MRGGNPINYTTLLITIYTVYIPLTLHNTVTLLNSTNKFPLLSDNTLQIPPPAAILL